jgi:hypothetical protein
MTKIEQIEEAIENGIGRKSKLTPLAISVPMLGSLNIRHLLNNLGAISTSFLEVGSHVGGSFVSAVFGNKNLEKAIAIDSWASDETEGQTYEQQFYENVLPVIGPDCPMQVIKSDSFCVDLSKLPKIDFYYFDGSHDYESQKNALLYYLPAMSEEFIFAVDDFMLPEVKKGTLDGIAMSGCEILYEQEFVTDTEYDNESFWRSWYVALLKKKP